MASSMIHIAVASELNKRIKADESKLLIGTIAPDISKLIGESKQKSHFLTENNDIPNLEMFLEKYKEHLNDSFVLGYYIHLFTDYLWFKYFIPKIYDKDLITKLDGTIVRCVDQMAQLYIYNDYTNLNIKLIDEYNLNLRIFYNSIPKINNIIDEIQMDKLYLIINKAGEIIMNTKVKKDMVFNMEHIRNFIELCVDIIFNDLKKQKVYTI